LHVNPQAPALQVADPFSGTEQVTQVAPQWMASVSARHDLSAEHEWKLVLHVYAQVPARHDADPLSGMGQLLVQEPQWVESVCRLLHVLLAGQKSGAAAVQLFVQR
jgi:hypothetical protein